MTCFLSKKGAGTLRACDAACVRCCADGAQLHPLRVGELVIDGGTLGYIMGTDLEQKLAQVGLTGCCHSISKCSEALRPAACCAAGCFVQRSRSGVHCCSTLLGLCFQPLSCVAASPLTSPAESPGCGRDKSCSCVM